MEKVKSILTGSEDEESIKRAYALFALKHIVCAPSRDKLDVDCLEYLIDTNALKKKPWATHAMASLAKGIRPYKNPRGKKELKKELSLGGCVLFLQVSSTICFLYAKYVFSEDNVHLMSFV